MNERGAIAIIEREHGSLEDFAVLILSEHREALNTDVSIMKRAQMVGLPVTVFSRIIASSQFRQMLRVDLVNKAYDIEAEMSHVGKVVEVASGKEKAVVTPQGHLAYVDQNPRDVMEAGRYLNELRGTPIEKASQSAPSVVINIGQATPGGEDVSPTIDVALEPHRPQRAGALPPAGVRARLGETVSGESPTRQPDDPDLGAFYGADAEEEDEDHRLREKAGRVHTGQEVGDEVDGDVIDMEEERKPIGFKRRRSNRWPRRSMTQHLTVPVYGPEGDE